MAQLVAHHTGSVGVRGSSPLSSTRETPKSHSFGFLLVEVPRRRLTTISTTVLFDLFDGIGSLFGSDYSRASATDGPRHPLVHDPQLGDTNFGARKSCHSGAVGRDGLWANNVLTIPPPWWETKLTVAAGLEIEP